MGLIVVAMGAGGVGCEFETIGSIDATNAQEHDTATSSLNDAEHAAIKAGENTGDVDSEPDDGAAYTAARRLEAETVYFNSLSELIDHSGVGADLDVHELIEQVVAATRDNDAEREEFLASLDPLREIDFVVEFLRETPMPRLASMNLVGVEGLTAAEVAELRLQISTENLLLMQSFEADVVEEATPVLESMGVGERLTLVELNPVGSTARLRGLGHDVTESIGAGIDRIRRVVPYVEPELSEPGSRAHLAASREQMNTDWMVGSYGTVSGTTWPPLHAYVAVVDTGVRASHLNLQENFALGAYARDCFNVSHSPGAGTCTSGGNPNWDPSDSCYDHGHKSVSIVGGSTNTGYYPVDNGVTRLVVDSYRNNGLMTCCNPDAQTNCRECQESGDFRSCIAGCPFDFVRCSGQQQLATRRGVQAALLNGAETVAASAQHSAYDPDFENEVRELFHSQDLAIVALAGNTSNGPCQNDVQTQAHPAVFSRVLSVGHYNAASSSHPLLGFCQGPTADNRVYPDLVFPSRVNTSSARHDYAAASYSGSSAATPHALGALALIRNRLFGDLGIRKPGYAYATLLAGGETVGSELDTTVGGAGRYRSDGPTDPLYVGSVVVSESSFTTVPIPVTSGCPPGVVAIPDRIKAAFWWAEDPDERSVILGLLRDQNNSTVQVSTSSGVFQRHEYDLPSPYPSGDWSLGIFAGHLPSNGLSGSTRRVYYAISLSDC